MNFYKLLAYFIILVIFLMIIQGCQTNSDMNQSEVNWIVRNL